MAATSDVLARSGFLTAFLLVSVAYAQKTMSASGPTDCDAEFARLMEDTRTYPDLASRTKRLERLAPHCKGSGIYQARLGYFYMQAGRYDEARQVVLAGLKAGPDDQKELQLALANIEFRQGRLAESERLAAALIKEHSDWNGGYLSLGETRLVQHRFEEGIQNLEHANALQPTAGAYVLLAMAYHQVGRPLDSARAMQRALRLDIGVLKNTQAVCAAAYSLIALGHGPEADDLLSKHLKVQPDATNNPTYKAAVARVREAHENPAAP